MINNLKVWKDTLFNENLIASLKLDKRCPFTRELNIFYYLPWIKTNPRKINIETGKFVTEEYNYDNSKIVEYMYDNEDYCRFLDEVYDKGNTSIKDWNYQQLIKLYGNNTLHIDFYNRILELAQENKLLSKEEIEYKTMLQEFLKDNVALMRCIKIDYKDEFDEYSDYNDLIKKGITDLSKIETISKKTGEYIAIRELINMGFKSFNHSPKIICSNQGIDIIAYNDKIYEFNEIVKPTRCIMPINNEILDSYQDEMFIPYSENRKLFRQYDQNYCTISVNRLYLPPIIDITTPLANTNSLILYPYKDSLKTGEIGKLNKGDYLFNKDKYQTKNKGYTYVKDRYRGYVPVR